MTSAAQAITWELWRRNRWSFAGVMVVTLSMGFINAGRARASHDLQAHEHWNYAILVFLFAVTFGCFHFTERRRKGGALSLPYRLFTLPVRTSLLVALPMGLGVVSVLALYWVWAVCVLSLLGRTLPLGWPCLYLATGMIVYQSILWSIPERRYLKLILLSFLAALLGLSWMFFTPSLVAGTLESFEISLFPQQFQRLLIVFMVVSSSVSIAICVHKVSTQRHGTARGAGIWHGVIDWIYDRFFVRRFPFRSLQQAQFWYEWRRSGLVLPACVGAILLMTYLPSAVFGGLNSKDTLYVLVWVFASPIALALFLGQGFGKPDFWSPNLDLPAFLLVRPMPEIDLILVKLKVAAVSVLITWGMIFYATVLWLGPVGQLWELEKLWRKLTLIFSGIETIGIVAAVFLSAMLLTWSLLVRTIPLALSMRKGLYYSVQITKMGCAVALIVLIVRVRNEPEILRGVFDRMSVLIWGLSLMFVAKIWLAIWAWNRAGERGLAPSSFMMTYFIVWLLGGSLIVGGLFAVVMFFWPFGLNIAWLRQICLFLGMMTMPLAGIGLGTLFMARGRHL